MKLTKMKLKLSLSVLCAVLTYTAVRSGGTIYLPAAVAGIMMGLLISHRPHLHYVKTGAITATVFALVFGVIMGFIDREMYQNTWGSFVAFSSLSFIPNILGLLASFLMKEIGMHVRGSLK